MNKITGLMAIKSFYDSKNDYIGAFSYFVFQIIEQDNSPSLNSIKIKMEERFEMSIPASIVKTLTKRLKKEGLVNYDDPSEEIFLTQKGTNIIQEINNEIRKTERESRALFDSIKNFVEQRSNLRVGVDEIENILKNLLNENIEEITLFFGGNQENFNYTTKESKSELCSLVGKFIIEAEEKDQENFDRIFDLANGIIMSSILKRDSLGDLNQKFDDTTVYLDSNLIFSLLGLHDIYFVKSAKELLELIKEFGFELKIFKFTKDQIIQKFEKYKEKEGDYTSEIEVRSIYWKLKSKGYTPTTIETELINDFDDKMNELGIKVDYHEKVDPSDITDIGSLSRYKDGFKDKRSLQHDLAACKEIEKKRGNTSRIIEESEVFFLTADRKLYRYNIYENGHINDSGKLSTIPEVITNNFLASVLWTKRPEHNAKLPLYNIIAGCKRNDLVTNNIWNKFINELKKKKDRLDMSEEMIQKIISRGETESFLKDKTDKELSKEKMDLFIEKIADKINQQEQKRKKEIKKTQKENVQIKNEKQDIIKEKDSVQKKLKSKNDYINHIFSNIEEKCHSFAKYFINFIFFILFTSISYLLIEKYLIVWWNQFQELLRNEHGWVEALLMSLNRIGLIGVVLVFFWLFLLFSFLPKRFLTKEWLKTPRKLRMKVSNYCGNYISIFIIKIFNLGDTGELKNKR